MHVFRLLRVNLSSQRFSEEVIPQELVLGYLGGKTLGFHYALLEGLPTAEPLSEANKLYFLGGVLTGLVAGAGATTLVTKSPATCTLTDPIAQSHFAYALRCAGYLGLVVEGISKEPVYLVVSNQKMRIVSALHLWGKPCSMVYDALRSENPEIPNSSVVAIGPAGENLVRFASVMVDTRAFGRGGAGAVMGYKRLKGIIAGGDNYPLPYDATIFEGQRSFLKKFVSTAEHKYRNYQHEGTSTIYNKHRHTGCMSGWNYRKYNYSSSKMKSLADEIVELFTKDPNVCFKCYLACARGGPITTGRFNGMRSNGPEFETIWAFGPQSNNDIVQTIVEADLACDELGLDSISSGNVIGFYFEAIEQGYLPGDLEKQDLVEILYDIAFRKGIGDLLAEGVMRAAQNIGAAAESFAMHVKGLETPAYDPRGFSGIALAYAVSPRGGCHRKSFCSDEAKGRISGSIVEGKPERVIEYENRAAYRDSLVVCKWASAGQEVPYYCSAVFGSVGLHLSEADLLSIGNKAINMARLFNSLQGYTRAHDTLPRRFLEQPKVNGPLAGAIVSSSDLERLKDRYYFLRGWSEQGLPSRESLTRIGIPDSIVILAAG